MIHVREFTSVDELMAHYAAVKQRLNPRAAIAPVIRREPRVVEITRPSYEHVRKARATVRFGEVFGPFPLDPVFAPHVAFDKAAANMGMARPNPKQIIAEVAERHGVTIESILGFRRDRRAVAARHEAMAEVYVKCEHLSLVQMGMLFKRDHTSCLHAVKKAGVWRGAEQ
jgi:chromosomal replication initiation ATPase DnaA